MGQNGSEIERETKEGEVEELATLHSRSNFIMITKEKEALQEMEEREVEVEELPIVAIYAISWGICHLSG